MIEDRKVRIDLTFAICNICFEDNPGRSGYSKSGNPPFLWACDECKDIAKHVVGISQVQRSHEDKMARDYAGSKGGAYLESIGKLDLSLLEKEEWEKFLDTLFRAKASELRRLLSPICMPY